MTKKFWLAAAVLAAPLWACPPPDPEPAEGPVTREGSYWVQTVDGNVTFPPGGRLKVDSVGSITVRGDAAGELRYAAKKRVRARSEAEARKLLSQAVIRAAREGPGVMLAVRDPQCGRCGFSAHLNISVPRAVQDALLTTHGGSLEAYDLDGGLTAQTAGGSIQLDRIGGAVRAETAGGSITLGAVGGPVRCETAGGSITLGSSRGDAVLTTNGGSIQGDQVGGSVRAETAGGSIRLGRVKGGVTAETAGGSIHLSHITGRVNADTAGGAIVVESATGGVRAENASGSIRLVDVAGALRAATAGGNIWARLAAGHPIAESYLETAMGEIVVLIPEGLKLTIRANVDVADSVNRIQCEFPGVQVRLLDQGPGPRTVVAEGAINGGGPVLRLHNMAGTILIKRRQ